MLVMHRKEETILETPAAAAITSPVQAKEEVVEEDPIYDIAEPQFSENVIQHLEIVPIKTKVNKKE